MKPRRISNLLSAILLAGLTILAARVATANSFWMTQVGCNNCREGHNDTQCLCEWDCGSCSGEPQTPCCTQWRWIQEPQYAGYCEAPWGGPGDCVSDCGWPEDSVYGYGDCYWRGWGLYDHWFSAGETWCNSETWSPTAACYPADQGCVNHPRTKFWWNSPICP